MKTIEITVDPRGASKIETKGFQGTECQRASQFLEQALGTRSQEQLTSDFYQVERTLQTRYEQS